MESNLMTPREIKFRAWFPSENRITPAKTVFELCQNANHFSQDLHEELTLLQFTGLKDKNGTDIYEGDIVTTFKLTEKCIGKIEYRDDIASFVVNEFLEGGWDSIEIAIEVIGNIYENPELLIT